MYKVEKYTFIKINTFDRSFIQSDFCAFIDICDLVFPENQTESTKQGYIAVKHSLNSRLIDPNVSESKVSQPRVCSGLTHKTFSTE